MWNDRAKTYKRVDGIDLNETHDGVVVYDEVNEKVHFINLAATAILELCDGKIDVGDIKAIMQTAFDLPNLPDKEVEACLAQLLSEGLIEECRTSSSEI
jgi:hypothetical protein